MYTLASKNKYGESCLKRGKAKNMNRLIVACCAVAVLAALPSFAQQKPYVVTSQGEKVRGSEIEADAAGNIRLQTDQGEVTYQSGQYKRAFQPKPEQVGKVVNFFKSEEYDKVIKYAPQVMEKYKYLGWGDMLAYLQGMALVKKGKPKDALQVIRRGEDFVQRYGDRLMKAKALALQKQGDTSEALKILNRLIEEGDSETAAFAFNTKGRIKAQNGEQKEAVLEYLKTVMLFKPSEVGQTREQAKQRAVQLLEEMGDPRAAKIRKLGK
mgnify:CR=1 FL=1